MIAWFCLFLGAGLALAQEPSRSQEQPSREESWALKKEVEQLGQQVTGKEKEGASVPWKIGAQWRIMANAANFGGAEVDRALNEALAQPGLEVFMSDRLQEIMLVLQKELPKLRRRYGVKDLALFGSYVQGEEKEGSDTAERAQRFVGEMTLDASLADDKTAFAVIRALTIIGEAAKKIPPSLQSRYPEVPRGKWPECWTSWPMTISVSTSDASSKQSSRTYPRCARLLEPVIADLEHEKRSQTDQRE